MKKIIIILFLSLFAFQLVYADEYTTDIIEDKPVDSMQKRYKWYKKEYKYMGFMNRINSTNYYQDINNYQEFYSAYKKYNNEKLDESYKIENLYDYYEAKKARYVMLKHKITTNDKINISELEIEDNNKNKINYEVHDFINCAKVTLDYINDGITNTSEKAQILRGGYLILKLDKDYDINNINIKLYINSTNSEQKSLIFYFCPTDSNSYKIYSTKEIDYSNIISNDEVTDTQMNIKVDNTWNNNFEYDFINFNNKIDEDKITLTSHYKEQKYYRKVTKKYATYKINKIYLDGYYTNVSLDGYYRDDNNYKLYYKYSNNLAVEMPITKLNTDKFISIINDENNEEEKNNNLEDTVNNTNKRQIVLLNKTTSEDKNEVNKECNNTIYKYITKYKIRYKYIHTVTLISIIINILLIMYLIYKKIKKNI